MRAVWVDANIIVRLVTDDPPELAAKAEALMSRAARGEFLLVVPVVVIAEVVWSLTSFYRYERSKIAAGLRSLITAEGIAVEGADAVLDALTLMANQNVDFADAYLAAIASSRSEEVATFDADFKRLGARMLAL